MISGYMHLMGLKSITVSVHAPVRIIDFGGWTDTWFAGHGKVLNFSALSRDANKGKGDYAGIEAVAKVSLTSGHGSFKLHAPDIGKSLVCLADKEDWDKMDLIEATLSSIRWPKGVDVDVVVQSPVVPKGSSVGSSATVSVVLTALIEFLSRSEVDPGWVARSCHEVETRVMGIECGVQDQAAAAHAYGVNFIDIYRYPNLSISKVAITESTRTELESRVLTVIYGGCHSSSDVHKMVIDRLQTTGRLSKDLERLRLIPEEARYCLLAGDFVGLGMAMKENTAAQRRLHAELISPECQKLIDFCQSHGTLGEKVNGAGGPQGGSLSVLAGDVPKRELVQVIKGSFPDLLVLEHRLADGGLKVVVR